ncbi:N-acetyl-gamma-glutamyl-phosphate reductase [Gammaproteobacteria bacterium]|nr:N-acetyl-gamma-glutamyl-phosphate reductase [Gammaproteobacteria bacterium]
MLKVGIVGATGYTGVELVRLLKTHQHVKLHAMSSRSETGTLVSDYFRNLEGHCDLKFTALDSLDLQECDIIFFATPHGVAMDRAPALLALGKKIIDLSADFRIQDVQLFKKWYGIEHSCPDLLKTAVYGLPEHNRARIKNASLIANPGCYPTIIGLGLTPFLKANVIDPKSLIADCKSGVSGAGRKAELGMIYCEVADSFKAYGVKGHRHHPEVTQELQKINADSKLTFMPHLVPMNRGMFATLYAKLNQDISLEKLQQILVNTYQNEPFIKILPPNSQPETRFVRGSNQIQYSINIHSDQLVILGAQDNLVKGAAGQAIQNMNIMCDFPENAGLELIGIIP